MEFLSIQPLGTPRYQWCQARAPKRTCWAKVEAELEPLKPLEPLEVLVPVMKCLIFAKKNHDCFMNFRQIYMI